jgi:hypothetical protein
MDMGRQFENTKAGGKVEPKERSKKEWKKKRTKDEEKIDRQKECYKHKDSNIEDSSAWEIINYWRVY